MIWPFALAMAIQLASGIAALLFRRSNRVALAIGSAGSFIASLIGVTAAGQLLLSGGSAVAAMPWQLPVGELLVGVDALSAFFLLCIYLVSGLSAVYAAGYFGDPSDSKAVAPKAVAPMVFSFALLVVSMAGITLARDGVLFLVAWELMSISGFFLVTFEHERQEVRSAGTVYLIASHVGVVLLLILFMLLAQHGGGFSFAAITAAGAPGPYLANACFILALVGFGTKAGFWSLHTWLPEAHPTAPSHISATMSGVMIKLGIYGVLRVLSFLGPPPLWWSVSVIGLGVVSGVLGVLHALAQHDLKRLLAYHSVENIGIIAIGIGVGLLGQSTGAPVVALLGYAGALLHTLNHGLFKGLLFHGAGSVLHATGTKSLDELGGLGRTMPITAVTFLIGSAAISGLPPLNGFISELLIYLGAFRGAAVLQSEAGQSPGTVAALAVIPALALIGGLAAACFVKAYGTIFLGHPRTAACDGAADPPPGMRLPMIIGAALCVAIGIWPAAALRLVERPASLIIGGAEPLPPLGQFVAAIPLVALVLVAVVIGLIGLRYALMRNREVAVGPTWGCGYEAPSSRMQYTAASFAEPVLEPFAVALKRPVHADLPKGYFPAAANYEQHAVDVIAEYVLAPASFGLLSALRKIRVIQTGHMQLYLGFILMTIVVLLVWYLPGGGG